MAPMIQWTYGREGDEAMRLRKGAMTLVMQDAGRVPTPAVMDGLAMDLDDPGAPLPPAPLARTFADCVQSCGMDASTALVWERYLSEAAAQQPNEVGFRSSLVGKMREDGLPASMRKALLARSLGVYRRRPAPRGPAYGGYAATGVGGRLYKARGEGSRGGHIVGHTRSGKPIYGSAASHYENIEQAQNADQHEFNLAEVQRVLPDYSSDDHKDAAAHHASHPGEDGDGEILSGIHAAAAAAPPPKRRRAARSASAGPTRGPYELGGKQRIGTTASGKQVHGPGNDMYRTAEGGVGTSTKALWRAHQDWSVQDHRDAAHLFDTSPHGQYGAHSAAGEAHHRVAAKKHAILNGATPTATSLGKTVSGKTVGGLSDERYSRPAHRGGKKSSSALANTGYLSHPDDVAHAIKASHGDFTAADHFDAAAMHARASTAAYSRVKDHHTRPAPGQFGMVGGRVHTTQDPSDRKALQEHWAHEGLSEGHRHVADDKLQAEQREGYYLHRGEDLARSKACEFSGAGVALRKGGRTRYRQCAAALLKATSDNDQVALDDMGYLVDAFGAPTLGQVLYDGLAAGMLSFDGKCFMALNVDMDLGQTPDIVTNNPPALVASI